MTDMTHFLRSLEAKDGVDPSEHRQKTWNWIGFIGGILGLIGGIIGILSFALKLAG